MTTDEPVVLRNSRSAHRLDIERAFVALAGLTRVRARAGRARLHLIGRSGSYAGAS